MAAEMEAPALVLGAQVSEAALDLGTVSETVSVATALEAQVWEEVLDLAMAAMAAMATVAWATALETELAAQVQATEATATEMEPAATA